VKQTYARLAQYFQRGTLICLALMLAIVAIDTLIAPSAARQPNVVVWLALSVPLLIFIPGVWRGGIYSFAWLSFVSLLYFAQGVTSLFAPWRRPLDILHLLISIVLFLCTMLFVRYSARAKRMAAT
jgi:uncharacterized membrane protein